MGSSRSTQSWSTCKHVDKKNAIPSSAWAWAATTAAGKHRDQRHACMYVDENVIHTFICMGFSAGCGCNGRTSCPSPSAQIAWQKSKTTNHTIETTLSHEKQKIKDIKASTAEVEVEKRKEEKTKKLLCADFLPMVLPRLEHLPTYTHTHLMQSRLRCGSISLCGHEWVISYTSCTRVISYTSYTWTHGEHHHDLKKTWNMCRICVLCVCVCGCVVEGVVIPCIYEVCIYHQPIQVT